MKIDLVGPARRGLAMGLNEAAGYGAVAITALATGYLAAAYGLRPAPFLLGAAYIALGLGLSAAAVRETRQYARHEAATHVAAPPAARRPPARARALPPGGRSSHRLRPGPVAPLPGRQGQQPQRRARLGPVPDPVRPARPYREADRHTRRPLPGGRGCRAARH